MLTKNWLNKTVTGHSLTQTLANWCLNLTEPQLWWLDHGHWCQNSKWAETSHGHGFDRGQVKQDRG